MTQRRGFSLKLAILTNLIKRYAAVISTHLGRAKFHATQATKMAI